MKTRNINRAKIDAVVRYPEDATVNGNREDNDYPTMPFLVEFDDPHHCDKWVWSFEMDLSTGQIINWPKGTTAKTNYKVCDRFKLTIDGLPTYDEYVPSFFGIDEHGYGDYIYVTIDENGFIQKWNKEHAAEWINDWLKAEDHEICVNIVESITNADLETKLQMIVEKQEAMNALNDEINLLKKDIISSMKKDNLTKITGGSYEATLKEVKPTKIADTEKMKADGIFEKYSKERAGYTSVSVSRA